jgi:hypothetical protein
VACPLGYRVERVRAVRVARLDRGLPAERVVRRARVASAPFDSRVDPDLTDDVEDDTGPAKRDGVVPVPEEVRG